MRKSLFLILYLGCFTSARAQLPVLSKRYDYGKSLYTSANYQAALDVFESILEKSPSPYEQFCLFFVGMCHYGLKQKDNAKSNFIRVLESPISTSLLKDEARYALGVIELENNNFEDALRYFQKIKDSEIVASSRNACKKHFYTLAPEKILLLNKIAPERMPEDLLFSKILTLPPAQRPNDLMPRLRQKFSAKASPNKRVGSDTVRIAFFMPFSLEKINPSNPFHNSQRYIDFFQGVRLAVRYLDSTGIPTKVYVYDTEKDSSKIVSLFMAAEARSMDVIVGPVVPTHFILGQEFAAQYKVPIVYPLWSTENINLKHPYTYSLTSSELTQAQVSAWFTWASLESKSAYILYDDSKADSLTAKAHAEAFEKAGGQVKLFFKINREKGLFPKLLSEIKKADSEKVNHHFFAAVRDEASALTLVSALTNLTGKRPLLIPNQWLDFNQIHYEQLEKLNAHILDPTYVSPEDSVNLRFIKSFTQLCNIIPFEPSYMGYEITVFFSKFFFKNRKKDLLQFHKLDPDRWGVLHGIDLRRSNDNRYFPILKFNNGELEIANSFEP